MFHVYEVPALLHMPPAAYRFVCGVSLVSFQSNLHSKAAHLKNYYAKNHHSKRENVYQVQLSKFRNHSRKLLWRKLPRIERPDSTSRSDLLLPWDLFQDSKPLCALASVSVKSNFIYLGLSLITQRGFR